MLGKRFELRRRFMFCADPLPGFLVGRDLPDNASPLTW